MPPGPDGSEANVVAQDTAAAPSDALPPEPTAEGVSSVESQGEDSAAESDTPTPDDESAEDGDEPEQSEQTEATESERRPSRKERQQAREQERIDKAVADAIAKRDREAAELADVQKREADARKAREAAAKEFAEYIGEEGEADRLTNEIADFNRQIRSELANPQGVDLDALEAQIVERETRLADIKRAKGFQDKIFQNVWNGIEAHMMRPLSHPEFADPATRQRYLNSEGGIAGAWDTGREIYRAAAFAEKDAEIAKIRADHKAEMAALEEDRNGWRIRAGGAEVPDTTSGGAVGGDSQVYTRERLRQMMQSDSGMAEYRRNKAEIERQLAAGLIR